MYSHMTNEQYTEYTRGIRQRQYSGGFAGHDFASDARGVLYPPRPEPLCTALVSVRPYSGDPGRCEQLVSNMPY